MLRAEPEHPDASTSSTETSAVGDTSKRPLKKSLSLVEHSALFTGGEAHETS
jgi:hypothetical protein